MNAPDLLSFKEGYKVGLEDGYYRALQHLKLVSKDNLEGVIQDLLLKEEYKKTCKNFIEEIENNIEYLF